MSILWSCDPTPPPGTYKHTVFFIIEQTCGFGPEFKVGHGSCSCLLHLRHWIVFKKSKNYFVCLLCCQHKLILPITLWLYTYLIWHNNCIVMPRFKIGLLKFQKQMKQFWTHMHAWTYTHTQTHTHFYFSLKFWASMFHWSIFPLLCSPNLTVKS